MTYERTAGDLAATTAATGAAPVLALGCPIYTADDDTLGTVKEVRGSAFKVDAPRQPDYWLSTGSIRLAGTNRIDLAFPKDRLGDYKLDSPVQG